MHFFRNRAFLCDVWSEEIQPLYPIDHGDRFNPQKPFSLILQLHRLLAPFDRILLKFRQTSQLRLQPSQLGMLGLRELKQCCRNPDDLDERQTNRRRGRSEVNNGHFEKPKNAYNQDFYCSCPFPTMAWVAAKRCLNTPLRHINGGLSDGLGLVKKRRASLVQRRPD